MEPLRLKIGVDCVCQAAPNPGYSSMGVGSRPKMGHSSQVVQGQAALG